jgi:hypothetical protein
MTKKLVRAQDPPWWEDTHAQLKEARAEGGELAGQLEARIRAGYLRQIRRELEEDEDLRKKVADAVPAADAKPVVLESLCHLARFGSDDLFEEAVGQVLKELEVQRKAEPALYLVNDETGELVMPITEKDIFVPPDYVDEGGTLRPARPVVHPGIAAGLAMMAAKAHRRRKVSDLAGEDPVRSKAYEHILEPERILEMAKEKLAHAEVSFTELPEEREEDIEFGRESLEGTQSVNPAFHRSSMFASILAQKVLKVCGRGEVEFGRIRPMEDKKSRWFVVGVRWRSSD